MPRTCPCLCIPSPADPVPLSPSAKPRKTRVSLRHSTLIPSALEKSSNSSSLHGSNLINRYVYHSFEHIFYISSNAVMSDLLVFSVTRFL